MFRISFRMRFEHHVEHLLHTEEEAEQRAKNMW